LGKISQSMSFSAGKSVTIVQNLGMVRDLLCVMSWKTRLPGIREEKMKRIAVLTSGGDAPGMNAAIRAVVRTGLDHGWEVFGVGHGYAGLMAGDFIKLGARDVGGIIQLGGTKLGSGRCLEFKTEEGLMKALRQLNEYEISALIVIGGDGSQKGAYVISQTGFPVVGIASTIDNDLYGSEITIGVDTALNVALEAIDRLKVTASSFTKSNLHLSL